MGAEVNGAEDDLACLARVARALTAAVGHPEILDVVVREGMAGLGAEGGVLAFVVDDVLAPVAMAGYPREALAAFAPMTLDRALPLTVAARTGEAVWVESPDDAAARYPDLVAARETRSQAWAAIPLDVGGVVLGVLGISFVAPRDFGERDRQLMLALADQCALALVARGAAVPTAVPVTLPRPREVLARPAGAPIRTVLVRPYGQAADLARAIRGDARFALTEYDDYEALADPDRPAFVDVIVIAGDLGAASRASAVGTVRARWPGASIVVLTGDSAVEEQARRLGADAVFGMSVPGGWLCAALAEVAAQAPAKTIAVDAGEGLALGLDELSGLMFERSADAMLFTAPDGRVLAANAAACELLQLPEQEICRRGRAGLADPADPRWIAAVSVRQATGRFFGELSMVRGDGQTFPAEVSSALFVGPDGSERTVVVMRDVTERKDAERRLRDLGHVDELTGALNRRGFCAKVPERLRAATRAGAGSALLFVDVDRLKQLNDSWGYATGDAALREVAELLRSSARDDDVIARWGGDEFVVLTQLRAGDTPESVARRAKNRFHIRNAQAPPYPLHVSIGAEALPAGAATEVGAAVTAAHAAMARHREHGRARRRRSTR